MPKGPKGEKRLADAIVSAVLVMEIAMGEVVDTGPRAGAKNHGSDH